jgi:histidine triad (HIT) family protein
MDAYGHTIIAPVTHIEDIYHDDPDILKKLTVACKEIALLYNKKLGATRVNLLHASGLSAQQSVQHLHFHLISRFDDDGLNAWPDLPGSIANNDQLLEIITRVKK